MKNILRLALLLTVAPAQAAVFMIDFGPTEAAGASLTNSPYHAAGGSASNSQWNTVGVSDVSSGLSYADGSIATGVTVNLGVGAETTAINLSTQPSSSSALGSQQNTGIYASTSVGTDAIFSGAGGSSNNLGVQITGLAAGIYEVFVVSRNTNNFGTTTIANYVGIGTAGDFDYSGYASNGITYSGGANTHTTAWVESGNAEANYTKFTVTLGAGQALNIAAAGMAGDTRGFLNSIQIAQVPEPSAFAMASVALIPLLRRRRGSATQLP